MESSRVNTAYLKAIENEIDSKYRYREVEDESRLPADFDEVQTENKRTLDIARGAHDLTDDQIARILAAANYHLHDKEEFIHWCVRGKCILMCNGSPARGKRLFILALMVAFVAHMVSPELYRWKGFLEDPPFLIIEI